MSLHIIVLYLNSPRQMPNENMQRCVASSRRGSPNWRRSIYDSRTLRVVGPRAKQRQAHRAPRLRQISSIRMRTESCVSLRSVCELWKPKLRRGGGTRKALKWRSVSMRDEVGILIELTLLGI